MRWHNQPYACILTDPNLDTTLGVGKKYTLKLLELEGDVKVDKINASSNDLCSYTETIEQN
jgi:hypothetical protein